MTEARAVTVAAPEPARRELALSGLSHALCPARGALMGAGERGEGRDARQALRQTYCVVWRCRDAAAVAVAATAIVSRSAPIATRRTRAMHA